MGRKVGIEEAKIYFQEQGSQSITAHYLRCGAKSGKIPHMRIGNRIIFDIDILEDFFRQQSLESIKLPDLKDEVYGRLRKIKE